MIHNIYAFVGKYLWTLVFDITETLIEKSCFLEIKAQIF